MQNTLNQQPIITESLTVPHRTESLESLAGEARLIIETTREIVDTRSQNPNRLGIDAHSLVGTLHRMTAHDMAESAIEDPMTSRLIQPVSETSLVRLAALQEGHILDPLTGQLAVDHIKHNLAHGEASNPNRNEKQLLNMLKNLKVTAHKMALLSNNPDLNLRDILNVENPVVHIGGNPRPEVEDEVRRRTQIDLEDPLIQAICDILNDEVMARHTELQLPIDNVTIIMQDQVGVTAA